MIRIYGASDDLVEFEGCKAADEIGRYDKDVHFVIGDPEAKPGRDASGLRVWMHYSDLGVWAASVLQLEEDVPIPWPVTIRTGEPSRGYSVIVEIDAPKDTPVSWEVVESGSP